MKFRREPESLSGRKSVAIAAGPASACVMKMLDLKIPSKRLFSAALSSPADLRG
jgi:hypothetical protein